MDTIFWQRKKKPNLVQLVEVENELYRTLLQTKFLSTHNSYITKKQLEGKLSREFVLEQLKDLDKFPICIEIDIKPKDNKFLIDHFTTNAESQPLLLIDELNSLYDFLNEGDVKFKKNDTFPLILSIDTTQISHSHENLIKIKELEESNDNNKSTDNNVQSNIDMGKEIRDFYKKITKNKHAIERATSTSSQFNIDDDDEDKVKKTEDFKRLNREVYHCKFNQIGYKTGDIEKHFFDISEYFFEELTKLCEKLNEQLEQEKKINTSDFNESRRREEITTLLMTEINPTKDKTNDNSVKLLFYYMSNDKQKVNNFFDSMKDSEKDKYKELIDTYSSGCMSVHTPLSKLMNKVLIRYRNHIPFTNSSDSSFSTKSNGKILPLNTVHLGMNTSHLANNHKNKHKNSVSTFYSSLIQTAKKISLKNKKKNKKINRAFPFFLDSRFNNVYKNLNTKILNLNYDPSLNFFNILAFNWHDVDESTRADLLKNFEEAYTPFLQNWSKLKSTFKPLEEESFAGGSSRKKRNLKRKKSKKKSKRLRRKSRKL